MPLEAFNNHVINVSLHVPSDLVFEDLNYHTLVGSSGVYEPEGHNHVRIDGHVGGECGLGDVLRIYANLVVS